MWDVFNAFEVCANKMPSAYRQVWTQGRDSPCLASCLEPPFAVPAGAREERGLPGLASRSLLSWQGAASHRPQPKLDHALPRILLKGSACNATSSAELASWGCRNNEPQTGGFKTTGMSHPPVLEAGKSEVSRAASLRLVESFTAPPQLLGVP